MMPIYRDIKIKVDKIINELALNPRVLDFLLYSQIIT